MLLRTPPRTGCFAAVLLLSGAAGAACASDKVTLPVSLSGDRMSLNKQDLPLGAAHWADPERNWRTVGELIKTALPPADADGTRPGVTLAVELDRQAPWGALKCLLMAASALGVRKSEMSIPVRPRGDVVALELPGADASAAQVVTVPLFTGGQTGVQTEVGTQRVPCTAKLFQDLVAQHPKATVNVQAPPSLPAFLVVAVLRDVQAARPAGMAFLPPNIKVRADEEASLKEAKDAVDRALQGGLGGMGK
jgi:hypothetical protein